MIRDEQLEVISDKIRMGIPVGFFEAIAAIDYQEARKRFARENVWWRRAVRRIKSAAHPAQAGGGAGDSEPMFYIQDTRSYVGNCPLWWCPDGRGYTTRIDEAGKYTREAAHTKRDTDKPWPCELVDSIVRPTIDMQELHKITAKPGAEG